MAGLLVGAALWGTAADIAPLVEPLRAVGPEGRGNAAAGPAWRQLSSQPPSTLPALLASMDGANDISANYLRSAAEVILQKGQAQGAAIPYAELESFLSETRHDRRARRFAYETILAHDPAAAAALLPGMLDDPAMELRRDAVGQLIDKAGKLQSGGSTNEAVALFQKALHHARDVDQIEAITAPLRKLGQSPDLASLFGWVRSWKVIGPFDNTKREGYDKAFPPEREIKLDGVYDGKGGKVHWGDLESRDDYGKVDVNLPLGKLKETIAYCYTEVRSERAQPAEIRLGCKNAWKVWFNGRLLFGRDEYHRNEEIDQYRLPVELQAGRNTLLVKLGQNEQVEEWTVEWEFRLRITDPLGTPLRSLKVGVPAPTTASTARP